MAKEPDLSLQRVSVLMPGLRVSKKLSLRIITQLARFEKTPSDKSCKAPEIAVVNWWLKSRAVTISVKIPSLAKHRAGVPCSAS